LKAEWGKELKEGGGEDVESGGRGGGRIGRGGRGGEKGR